MAKPYSDDLRKRVVAAVEGGLSRRQAASSFDLLRFLIRLASIDIAIGAPTDQLWKS